MSDVERRSGRTTRMLEAVLAYSRAHTKQDIRVLVLAKSRDEVARVMQQFQKLCSCELARCVEFVDQTAVILVDRTDYPAPYRHVISFSAHLVNFDWVNWRDLKTDYSHVFVDHFAIESRFALMLEELRRYDLPV